MAQSNAQHDTAHSTASSAVDATLSHGQDKEQADSEVALRQEGAAQQQQQQQQQLALQGTLGAADGVVAVEEVVAAAVSSMHVRAALHGVATKQQLCAR